LLSAVTTEHRLAGCQPEPLLSYLKGLGVLRLVAEQADPEATGCWAPDGFVLTCRLDEERLARFFLDDYQPTPILSPWNGSSGFGKEGEQELGAIERSDLARLAPFREAALVARRLWERLGGDKGRKAELIAACRAEFPESAVPWIDASAVLVDDRVVYPPVLGTGGNDGRLDFSRNFHQRILEVVGLGRSAPASRRAWLDAALDGTPSTLLPASPGQFDPGAAGAPNSAPTGAADGLVNPWDWVLLIEGSLLFAAGAARRLAASTAGRAAAPFTVEASAAGYATATAAEKSRGELWLPLWSRPAPYGEVRRLFAEARADWQGRRATSALDLVRATGDLGVDRGITAFSRHVLAERNGRSTIATPAGRVGVTRRPAVVPLSDLDDWMNRVRRAGDAPAAIGAGLRKLERVMFSAAASPRPDLVPVLVAAAELNAAVARSAGVRALVPDLRLRGRQWLNAIDIAHPKETELRLAVSLASGVDGASGRCALRRLVMTGWKGEVVSPAAVQGVGIRPAIEVVAAAHARRAIERTADQREERATDQPGVVSAFDRGWPASLADVVALATGQIDEARFDQLLRAFLLLDIPPGGMLRAPARGLPVPPALAVLVPFYGPAGGEGGEGGEGAGGEGGEGGGEVGEPATWRHRLAAARLRPEASWVAQLVAGQVEAPLAAAVRRLRIAGLRPLVDAKCASLGLRPRSGVWLAAALLVPLRPEKRIDLLNRVCPGPEDEKGPENPMQQNHEQGGGNAQA